MGCGTSSARSSVISPVTKVRAEKDTNNITEKKLDLHESVDVVMPSNNPRRKNTLSCDKEVVSTLQENENALKNGDKGCGQSATEAYSKQPDKFSSPVQQNDMSKDVRDFQLDFSPEVVSHRKKVKQTFDSLANIEVKREKFQEILDTIKDILKLRKEGKEKEKSSLAEKDFIYLAYFDYIVELNWVAIYLDVFHKLHEVCPDAFTGPSADKSYQV